MLYLVLVGHFLKQFKQGNFFIATIGPERYTTGSQLSSVSYTAKINSAVYHTLRSGKLHDVSYTTEYICTVLGGVRYTRESNTKQMKATTALKETNLQKTNQRCTLLSYNMINMKI